jgi:urea transport system permease protein
VPLFLIGAVTAIFGPQTATTISPPIGPFSIGDYSSSGYELFLILLTLALFAVVFGVLRFSKLGLLARGTMQHADMAAVLGVSTSQIYMITFGMGSAVAGLAGGVLAPLTGVVPTIGATYIAKAFITVISGGTAILAGTASAAVLLGAMNSIVTYITGPTVGEVALLGAAIVLLRLMPNGITGRFFRNSQ